MTDQQQFNIGDKVTFKAGLFGRGRVIGKTQNGKLFIKTKYSRDGHDQIRIVEPQKVRHAES
jgi:hypothetical protein